MSFFSDLLKSKDEKWLESASRKELSDAYEKERQQWIKNGQNGTGKKTQKMKRLDEEIGKRIEDERKKDSKRSKDPNYRWTDANLWDKD